MDRVRAKVKVMGKSSFGNGSGGSVTLSAVYSTDPASENKVFSDFTPSLNVEIFVLKEETFNFYEQDAEYYLDFTKAPTVKDEAAYEGDD